MSFQLLRVGHGVYVPTDQIVLLQEFPTRPGRRDKQSAEAAGVWKDATSLAGAARRRDPVRCRVYLRCGFLIGSPYAVETLVNRSPIAAPVRPSTRRQSAEPEPIGPPFSSEIPAAPLEVADKNDEEIEDAPTQSWLKRLQRA